MFSLSILKRFRSDESGATAIEYGLIVSLIVIASIGAFDSVANENDGIWARVTDKVVEAHSGT
ncbi:MAG: Flp family type IVb pilin [Erythrobacter sp.]